MSEIVTIQHLSKRFTSNGKTVTALKDINLSIEEGSFTSIIGASGCGKSTLLRIIGGLETDNYPDLAARIHTRSPKRYLYEVAETIKAGEGFPKLINDEDVVPLLLSKGATLDEAYDYSVSGCAECRMPNRDTYTSPNAYINFAAALEMVIYNGRML